MQEIIFTAPGSKRPFPKAAPALHGITIMGAAMGLTGRNTAGSYAAALCKVGLLKIFAAAYKRIIVNN